MVQQASQLWAKTHQEGTPAWHPLTLHMLDVAAAAEAILAREPEQTRNRMAAILGQGQCPGSSPSHHHSWKDSPQPFMDSK